MTDLVDQMFPPITARHERNPRNPEFNDFNFWRASMPDIELPPDDELIPTPPVSPALSARSGRSVRSDTSARSGRSGSTAGAGYEGEVEKPGRLSRFGLGSLGLSRRGSAATVPATDEKRAATVPHGGLPESSSAPDLQEAAARDPPLRANSDLPTTTAGGEASSPSSEYGYGSGVTRWASSWAGRRAASPGGGTRPTSPLVGPVITAEPESDEEAEDSGAGSDDDVSSFGGRSRRMSSEEPGEFGEEEEEEEEGQDEEEEYAQGEDGDVPEMGDDVLDDDVLATGEIRFEWRG